MSRTFGCTPIPLASFLSEWESINRDLVLLAHAPFTTYPFALFPNGTAASTAPDMSSSSSSTTTSPSSAAVMSAVGVYEKVYELLCGLGPVQGNRDPARRRTWHNSSPISPYADGDSSDDGSSDGEDEADAPHDGGVSGGGGGEQDMAPRKNAGSSQQGESAQAQSREQSRAQKRKAAEKGRANRCVYDRMELLLHLAHSSVWLWTAVMGKATGGRLKLPSEISDFLIALGVPPPPLSASERAGSGSESGASGYSPLHRRLDSERDRTLWHETLRRTAHAWLSPLGGSSGSHGEGDDTDAGAVLHAEVSRYFLSPPLTDPITAAAAECGEDGDPEEGCQATPTTTAVDPLPSSLSVERLVSLHAMVTVAQHFLLFSQTIRTAFLRLALVVQERKGEEAAAIGQDGPVSWRFYRALLRRHSEGRTAEGHVSNSNSNANSNANSAANATSSSVSPRKVGVGDGNIAQLLLNEAMHAVLARNTAWVRAVIASAASATIGREDLETPSVLLTSAPSTPLTTAAAAAKLSASKQKRRESSAAVLPHLDWWEVARYIEEFDIKHVFRLHTMVEQTQSSELQAWTMTVVERSCFMRGRRLLNTTLASAMPTFTCVEDTEGKVGDGSGNRQMTALAAMPADRARVRNDAAPALAIAAELLDEALSLDEPYTCTTANRDAASPSGQSQRSVPSARLARANQALRDALQAYIRLRSALMLFNAGTVHYMDALTACGTQRFIAGLRTFSRGFCSPRHLPPDHDGPTDSSTPSASWGVNVSIPVSCDVRTFVLVYGVPLWLQLCEKTKRRHAEARGLLVTGNRGRRRTSADGLGGTEEARGVGLAGPPLSSADLRHARREHSSEGGGGRSRIGSAREHSDGDDDDAGRQHTMTPPSSHAPTEAPVPLTVPIPASPHTREGGKGSSSNYYRKGAATATPTDDRIPFLDALSDATSAKADRERQNWLRRALGADEDEDAEEQRELQLMASLPEDGLPTLLYLLTKQDPDRRNILSTFSEQIHRYLVLLLARSSQRRNAGEAGAAPASAAARQRHVTQGPPVADAPQPLPASVFEKCVFALHMTQSAFARQEARDGSSGGGGANPMVGNEHDSSIHPALAALAETAGSAVCKGLQCFFAEFESRVSSTLAHALHAQILEDATRRHATRADDETPEVDHHHHHVEAGNQRTATLQVVDTLLALASLLPTRELFVRQCKALMAPRLMSLRSAKALEVDTEVLSRMALRLGATAVYPCTTLLYDLRHAMASTRGREPRDKNASSRRKRGGGSNSNSNNDDDGHHDGKDNVGGEAVRQGQRARRRHEDDGHERMQRLPDNEQHQQQQQQSGGGGSGSGGEQGSTGGDLEDPGSPHLLLLSGQRTTSLAHPANHHVSSHGGGGGLGALLMSSPIAGPSRSPVAFALSLLGGGAAASYGNAAASHERRRRGGGSLSDRIPPSPHFIKRLRVLCAAWWAPHAGPLLSAKAIQRLYEHRKFFDEKVVDAVLRTEWYYCDPQGHQQQQQRQQQQQQQQATDAEASSSSSSASEGPPPFPGYGRYRARNLENSTGTAHPRTVSFDSTVTDEFGRSCPSNNSANTATAANRSPSLFSLSQASQSLHNISHVLRRTETRSSAFGNDYPDDDDDEDFRAAYGGVLSASGQRSGGGGAAMASHRGWEGGNPALRLRPGQNSADELGSVSSFDGTGAPSDAGVGMGSADGSSYGNEGSPFYVSGANPPLERRRLRWPVACGELVFLVRPLRTESDKGEAAPSAFFQVTGPPIALLLLQVLQNAQERRAGGGSSRGLTLAQLCQRTPVPTPKPIIAATLKVFLGAGLVQRKVDPQLKQHVYFIPDSFDPPCSPASPSSSATAAAEAKAKRRKRRVVVDITTVLQQLPILSSSNEERHGEGDGAAEKSLGDGGKENGDDGDLPTRVPPDDGAARLDMDRVGSGEGRNDSASSSSPPPVLLSATPPPPVLSGSHTPPSPSSPELEKQLTHTAEAAIVKLLKQTQGMSHQSLATAVAERMGSRYSRVLFKTAIAHLLERDFIRRAEGENVFVYVP